MIEIANNGLNNLEYKDITLSLVFEYIFNTEELLKLLEKFQVNTKNQEWIKESIITNSKKYLDELPYFRNLFVYLDNLK
ncbi:hypothetical protein AYI68_g7611 [Smittium mucronatum]|uniref:Uncharacterized protein n=1 Tax=Smittium mucronatum TaxID=133383 RepID=A0A1R0GN80_9FUNG|nr:hypothetical protein AYI68_g7611 [Smittium mucronatum]